MKLSDCPEFFCTRATKPQTSRKVVVLRSRGFGVYEEMVAKFDKPSNSFRHFTGNKLGTRVTGVIGWKEYTDPENPHADMKVFG